MATRSAIGMQNRDGSVTAVYCHYDGYPEHNGAILLEHYGRVKTQQLLALGDLSSLGSEVGQKHPFSGFYVKDPQLSEEDNAVKAAAVQAAYAAAQAAGWTTFYHRDRGETGVDAETYASIEDYTDNFTHCDINYFYLLVNDAWQVRPAFDGGQWEDLANVLVNSAEEMV